MGISRSDSAWGPWAASAALPIAFGPWLRSQYLLPKMAAAAFFLAWGWVWLACSPRLNPVRSRVDAAVAAFCAAAVLSSLFSSDPWLSWFGHDGEYLFGMAGMAACVAAFYLGCAWERAGKTGRLLDWLALGSLPVSAYAWLEALGWRPYAWDLLPKGRAASTLGSPVALGAYLALVIPIGVYLRGLPRRRWLGFACLILAVPALAATGSRGAWAGAALGAAISSMAWGKEWRAEKSRALRVAVALAVLFFAAALANRLRVGMGGSDGARVQMWRIAWAEAKERPWLGSGVDTYVIAFRRHNNPTLARIYSRVGVQSEAHNDWMQIWATMGIVGLASYAWLHARALREIGPRARMDPRIAAMAGGVAAVLFAAKFNSPSFAAAWLAACLGGCLLAWPASDAAARAAAEHISQPAAARSGSALEPRGSRAGLLPAALFVLASGWFFCASARLVAADRGDALGRRLRAAGQPRAAVENFLRAAALSPGTVQYRFDLANALWDAAQGTRDASSRRALLLAAAQEAEQGVRVRPRDAEALRLLGLSQLRLAQWGGEATLPSARRALEASLALDPYYGYTLEDLGTVASLQKDEDLGAEMQRRLNLIK